MSTFFLNIIIFSFAQGRWVNHICNYISLVNFMRLAGRSLFNLLVFLTFYWSISLSLLNHYFFWCVFGSRYCLINCKACLHSFFKNSCMSEFVSAVCGWYTNKSPPVPYAFVNKKGKGMEVCSLSDMKLECSWSS